MLNINYWEELLIVIFRWLRPIKLISCTLA